MDIIKVGGHQTTLAIGFSARDTLVRARKRLNRAIISERRPFGINDHLSCDIL